MKLKQNPHYQKLVSNLVDAYKESLNLEDLPQGKDIIENTETALVQTILAIDGMEIEEATDLLKKNGLDELAENVSTL